MRDCDCCDNCEDNGHQWVKTGEHPDGTCFYRCRVCGETAEN
jgi:hypothetical protein